MEKIIIVRTIVDQKLISYIWCIKAYDEKCTGFEIVTKKFGKWVKFQDEATLADSKETVTVFLFRGLKVFECIKKSFIVKQRKNI